MVNVVYSQGAYDVARGYAASVGWNFFVARCMKAPATQARPDIINAEFNNNLSARDHLDRQTVLGARIDV